MKESHISYRYFFSNNEIYFYFFLPHRFNIVSEEDLGNYSCMFGSEAKIDFVLAGIDRILSYIEITFYISQPAFVSSSAY